MKLHIECIQDKYDSLKKEKDKIKSEMETEIS